MKAKLKREKKALVVDTCKKLLKQTDQEFSSDDEHIPDNSRSVDPYVIDEVAKNIELNANKFHTEFYFPHFVTNFNC